MTEQTDPGLEPCPFCRSPVEVIALEGDFMRYYPSLFKCTNPDCGVRFMFPMDVGWAKERERELWNRRAEE